MQNVYHIASIHKCCNFSRKGAKTPRKNISRHSIAMVLTLRSWRLGESYFLRDEPYLDKAATDPLFLCGILA